MRNLPISITLACAIGCVLAITRPIAAQQTSAVVADLVRKSNSGDVPAGHVTLSGEKIRLETPDLPDGYFIIDGAVPAAMFVRPAARVYMDARRSSQLTQLFVPVDANAPCGQWQAMARVAGEVERSDWQCTRLGEETIDGRSTIIYRAVVAGEERLTGWIDPQLGFPLQIGLPDGTVFAAASIHEQAEPSELYTVPAGFKKFDPEALLQRVKQSDVWVEPH